MRSHKLCVHVTLEGEVEEEGWVRGVDEGRGLARILDSSRFEAPISGMCKCATAALLNSAHELHRDAPQDRDARAPVQGKRQEKLQRGKEVRGLSTNTMDGTGIHVPSRPLICQSRSHAHTAGRSKKRGK